MVEEHERPDAPGIDMREHAAHREAAEVVDARIDNRQG
jgi:hypothetical protein